jgi:hypothetical protein
MAVTTPSKKIALSAQLECFLDVFFFPANQLALAKQSLFAGYLVGFLLKGSLTGNL